VKGDGLTVESALRANIRDLDEARRSRIHLTPEHLLKPLDQSLALQARQPLDPEQAVDASVLLGTLF
jgi:hypothetical protein